MPSSWFSIALNKADKTAADVSIHNEIGYWGISAKQFMEQLRLLGDEIKTINLSIHSPGGEVLDGWAIYNALQLHSAKVIVTIKGIAASMASVIMLAGDEVLIPKNAYIMIHRVSGVAFGDADAMRDYADLTEKLEDGIVSAYAERSGLDESEIRKMMEKETWMTGEEAVANGFADKVIAAVSATNKGTWKARFSEAPKPIFDNGRPSATPPPSNDIDMTPNEITDLIAKGIKDGLAAHLTNQATAIATEVTNAVTTATKPLSDQFTKMSDDFQKLADRVEKAEGIIKSGVAGAAGGSPPVGGSGNGGDDDLKASAPANEDELRKALAGKSHAEKRQIIAAYDAAKGKK